MPARLAESGVSRPRDSQSASPEGSSTREVSFRELPSVDSSLIRLLSTGSSDSVVSSCLAESIASSLESSAKETLPPVVSKAEAERVLSSAQVVDSRREGSWLGATLLSKSLEASARALLSSSARELASVLDGVVSTESSLNCDDSFKLFASVALGALC